jgi:glycerophosphoryl diester phosphodiesterase
LEISPTEQIDFKETKDNFLVISHDKNPGRGPYPEYRTFYTDNVKQASSISMTLQHVLHAYNSYIKQ